MTTDTQIPLSKPESTKALKADLDQQKMSKKKYETIKKVLQVELLKVQKWVKESGEKVVILFEGRIVCITF